MSFLEKSAWITVVTLVIVYGQYFFWLGSGYAAGTPVPLEATLRPLITTTVLWIVTLVIGHAVIGGFSGRGETGQGDERDRLIEMKASQPTAVVMGFGLFGIIAMAYAGIDRALIVHHLIGLQVLAALVEFGSRIRSYRMAI